MVTTVPRRIKSKNKNLKKMQKGKNLMTTIGAITSRMNRNSPRMKNQW